MRTWRIPRVRANIGEPALFVDVAIARGDYAGLEGGQEDVRKLESLGFVQSHQTDHVLIPVRFAVRRQRRMIQEFPRAVEAAWTRTCRPNARDSRRR